MAASPLTLVERNVIISRLVHKDHNLINDSVYATAKGASEENLGIFQVETRIEFNKFGKSPLKNKFTHLLFRKSPNSLISQKSENALIRKRTPNHTPPYMTSQKM